MSKIGLLPILALFLCMNSACKMQTPEQRKAEKEKMRRNLDNNFVDRWNLHVKSKTEPEAQPLPPSNDFEPMPEVDADGEENGTVHAFLFDDKVCFSKDKFAHGKTKCMDLKTKKSVTIDASKISIPDDVYVDIEVDTSVHIFSFKGKTCIAKNKFEKSLMKCWDPEKAENVSIDTRG